MNMKKLLIAALLAGSLGSVVSVAEAAVVVVREAPPAPRHEVVPAARRGYVWAPGHWEWRHNRYQWVRGTWLRDRRGYVYNAPAWEERDGRWMMQRGGWARGHRDRDGDGVPNRVDDHPNNPNRS
jgi:hypothetical protein